MGNLTKELGFTRSAVDKYVFYRGQTMYALYKEDSILVGNYQKEIDHIIEELNISKLILTAERDL